VFKKGAKGDKGDIGNQGWCSSKASSFAHFYQGDSNVGNKVPLALLAVMGCLGVR
jgi:hypothetical protein